MKLNQIQNIDAMDDALELAWKYYNEQRILLPEDRWSIINYIVMCYMKATGIKFMMMPENSLDALRALCKRIISEFSISTHNVEQEQVAI